MKKAQITAQDAKCIVCEEGITNPICPACLAKEIKAWNRKTDLVVPDSFGGVRCMLCGNGMNICAHCYSKDAHEAISFQSSELSEEFIEIFDYNLKEEFL